MPPLLRRRADRSRPPGADIRFVIFGQGRTGSSLLRALLNEHPQVRCDGEILAEEVADPVEIVVTEAESCPVRAYGFKVKIYQLTDSQRVDPGGFLTELISQGFSIVYLWRRNLLRHAVSNAFAEHRGRYHDKTTETETRPTVTLDPDVIVEAMRRRRGHLAAEAEVLRPFDHHTIVYEDDLLHAADHQRTMDALFAHLGLSPVPVDAPLARSVSGRLADRVDNYDALAAALTAAGLGEYLGDPAYDTTR